MLHRVERLAERFDRRHAVLLQYVHDLRLGYHHPGRKRAIIAGLFGGIDRPIEVVESRQQIEASFSWAYFER